MRSKLLAVATLLALAATGRRGRRWTRQGHARTEVGDRPGLRPERPAVRRRLASRATIFAIDTGDAKPAGDKAVNVEKIDGKIAAALGVTEKEVRINDVKVNPASGNIYLAVTRGTGAGTPAIVKVDARRHDRADGAQGRDVLQGGAAQPRPRARARPRSITSMAFLDGRLFVAGLSSEEFASTLRAIPFPFKDADKGTGDRDLPRRHTAGSRRRRPIRTFTPYKIGKEDHIMAAYTCTPLVKIPVSRPEAGREGEGRRRSPSWATATRRST